MKTRAGFFRDQLFWSEMPLFWQHKRPGLVAFDQMGIGINDRHNHRRKTLELPNF